MIKKIDIRHFQLFCGIGAGGKGFNRGRARVGNLTAQFRCIGGIDSNPAAIADFKTMAGVDGTLLDLFSREQYTAWHGHEPPPGWVEVCPADLRRAAGGEFPHIIFTSPPCKGFSGLLPQAISITEKYQALNLLTLRGIWLSLEAFKENPPEFFILENVPRIMTRGRPLLDQIVCLLEQYGYAARESTHDCGELGGLAQTRRRFLLVARHQEKVPSFLYEPQTRPLLGVGEVIGKFPMPGDPVAGPMHRIPALQWKTWVRLAFVEAGKDWRSLRRLAIEDGFLRDYLLVPEMHRGALGVRHWDQTGNTITGTCRSYNGAHNIADPRFSGESYGQYGVLQFGQQSGTVTSQRSPGQGSFSIADPRYRDGKLSHNNVFRVVRFNQNAGTVTAGQGPTNGGQAVADPRIEHYGNHAGKLRVENWSDTSHIVTGSDRVGSGALSVADPRPAGLNRKKGDHYLTGGHYGITPWSAYSNTISASAKHDNGFNSVADPRLPAPNEKCTPIIIAEDNTWHRPFTTLELAALQGLFTADDIGSLFGNSDSAHRERIGNAVPPPAAEAIASVMGEALLLSLAGETFQLSSTPVWVRPIAASISLPQNPFCRSS